MPNATENLPNHQGKIGDKVSVVKANSSSPGQDKFAKALASVLAADPKKIRDKEAQAKSEKPSPHTKYTYAPEEGQS
jgi:hypothetical protein